MNPDARLNILMARQHSLATRPQALETGLTSRQIVLRLESGLWVTQQRGVYRPSSVRPYFHLHVMAACLAVDACASHRCAAAVYGLRGFEDDLVEITVTSHRTQRLVDVTVHRDDRLDRRDVTTRWHLPITTPARTLLDIADQRSEAVERALNDALYRRLVRPEALRSTISRSQSFGAAVLLSEILDHLAAPTESVLEDDFLALTRRYGLPEPVRQWPIAGGEFRLDFAWPEAMVTYETHGWRHHSAPADRRRDRAKRKAAEAEGWNWNDAYWEDVHEWAADTMAGL
ncbi:MAG TPA: type IV toxin-antitoxin system AbiEi family antitoxin domain-containing protein, partial [Acidimicrobiia bacterium]